jgi:hypothetical protein
LFGIDLGPHDASPWGWTIAASYLLAAALSMAAGLVIRRRREESLRLEAFWYACAIALVALAVNKQLDLQTDLRRIGVHHAWEHGWYGERRVVQTWFIRGAIAGGALLTVALLIAFRRGTRQHWLAIAGLVGLITFVAIRAASFHDLDILLAHDLGADLTLSRTLELGSIVVIAAAAFWAGRWSPARERASQR